jgi:dipeptidyl aminopeptidase/acylaminoacyl peptidase
MLFVGYVVALAAVPIPIADFARTPNLSRLQLSLGGSRIGFVRETRGARRLFVADVDRVDQPREIPLGEVRGGLGRKEVGSFTWLSDERLLVTTIVANVTLYGAFAIDGDGGRRVAISGHELDDKEPRFFATEALYAFEDAGPSILMANDRTRFGDQTLYPNVVRVDTRSGREITVLENPGNVVAWGVDFAGDVRLGITSDAGKGNALQLGAIYRETAATPWRTLLELAPVNERIRPLDFEAGTDWLFVATWSPQQRTAVHRLDPSTGRLGPELLGDPEFDIVPDAFRPSFAGVGFGDTIASEEKGGIVGVRYCTDRIAMRWFDPEYEARQAVIDALLPGTMNIVCGATRDENVLLVLAFSDRHPGAYHLYDVRTETIRLLGERMGWLDPRAMAEMQPITFTARDGLTIHGYLALPAGAEPRGLPLVIVPHGGPAARSFWHFDPFVQVLASRGFAVLQPNYRGSTGYGREFHELGRREVGGKIQDDIEDATRWAIATGVADPARVAIVGESFGGYSALFALGQNPGLYRCGVSISGVSDWMELFKEGSSRPELTLARAHWVDQIGDPTGDEARLRAASPVNFADRITAPVLLMHGRDDRNVPVQQSRAMIKALKRAGREPASLFLADEGHSLSSEKSRTEALERLVEFLEKHLTR